MADDIGRSGAKAPSGSRPTDGAASVSTAVAASIPNADEELWRLSPHFRRFLQVVGSVERASAAWDIAREAFLPETPEAEFEVWQDGLCVASCSGPRAKAIAETVHYAVVYQTDDSPVEVQEVFRRAIDPDVALSIIAASGTEAGTGETEGLDPKGNGPASETGDAQGTQP